MSKSAGLTLGRVIEAGEATNWHYERACIHLGFKMRTGALRRFLENNGTSWGALALMNGRNYPNENSGHFEKHQWQPTLSEFVRCADEHDWKQTKMAEAHDCSTAHIYKLMRKFGYASWGALMEAQGLKMQVTPENVWRAMHECGATSCTTIARHMGHATSGAVKAGLARHGWAWSKFVTDYRPPGQLDIFEDDVVPKPKTQTGDKLVEAAKASGWHMDMTCWKLNLEDRKALLAQVKQRGYSDWQAFHDAHVTS